MINNHKTQGKWKIQLTIRIHFMSLKDPNKTRTIHSKSNNIEFLIKNETVEIIEEIFDPFLQKC